jgi:hypothetical protein
MTDHDSVEPPAALEERVVGTLRARGLLRAGAAVPRRASARWLAWPVALAAGVLLFIGGFAMGRRPAPSSLTGMTQYTLLLYEGPEFNTSGATEPELVKEYSAWAGELAGRGRLVSGEKLGSEHWTLGADRATHPAPTGFFIIAARDQGEALAIARTCPHLRYGGTVSVRPIEPT